ncbi:MAG: class I SAM-dependent methyltransferase [Elusimicrobiota bacterium]
MDKWEERQKYHFDQNAEAYPAMYGKDSPFHKAMTERFLALACPVPGEEVLDVGCGMGRTTVPLLEAGCNVTGIDISSQALMGIKGAFRRKRTVSEVPRYTAKSGVD